MRGQPGANTYRLPTGRPETTKATLARWPKSLILLDSQSRLISMILQCSRPPSPKGRGGPVKWSQTTSRQAACGCSPPHSPIAISFGGPSASPLTGQAKHGSGSVRGRLIPRYARAFALRWVGFVVGFSTFIFTPTPMGYHWPHWFLARLNYWLKYCSTWTIYLPQTY